MINIGFYGKMNGREQALRTPILSLNHPTVLAVEASLDSITVSPQIIDRFWTKVDRSGGQDSCWHWLASAYWNGYGQFHISCSDGRKSIGAHRIAWIITRGSIPHGLMVCHTCDRRSCVNPAHLFLGTAKDNTHDMMRKGRAATGDRSGARLHPERTPRGAEHYMAKLTSDDVRDIRRRASRGETRQSISEHYGITNTATTCIVNRVTWKHVADESNPSFVPLMKQPPHPWWTRTALDRERKAAA